MKLIGVEFDDYASFSKQFVRLDQQINLIVGRNNSGKTALLRGVSLINAVRGSGFVAAPDPVQYARNTQFNDVVIRLVFRLDNETARHFVEHDAIHYYVDDQHALLSIELAVVRGGGCYFGDANVIYGESAVPVFTRQNQRLDVNLLRTGGNYVPRIQVGFHGIYNRPNNLSYFQPVPDFIEVALKSLARVFLVEAHRTPKSEIALTPEANLNPDGSNLANFLHSLNSSRERDKFLEIERFVTTVFPEFSRVNPAELAPNGASVSITLTERGSNTTVPLTQCGTGVEQLLCLAAFVITGGKTSSRETLMFLLDEPHSYLHPDAERQLLAFLNAHPEHAYVVATHSPILVNSVSASAITYIERSRNTDVRSSTERIASDVMESLGYKNSDFLFHNRLIFVEGESDQLIVPILLNKRGSERLELAATGFPIIYGVPGAGRPGTHRKNVRGLQETILRCEKLLAQFGRAEVPHFFLLDGDFTDEERALLEHLEERGITVRFLKRFELENYLLVPSVIATVINRELSVSGSNETATEENVEAEVARCLGSGEVRFFPLGERGEPMRSIKGSILLDEIFQLYGLAYRKTTDGLMLAEMIPEETAWLAEIWNALSGLI
jgi:predicted ATPase